MKKVTIIALMFVLVFFGTLFAQGSIKSEVDKTKISTNETVTYKITISSKEGVPKLKLPSFEGFDVVSSAQSSSISFGQKNAESRITYVLVLAPNKTGKIHIEPSSISVQGKDYASDSFDIEVTGSSLPTPEDNIPLPEDGSSNQEDQTTL